jgi:hypothetical protein
MSERDEAQGARGEGTETVQGVRQAYDNAVAAQVNFGIAKVKRLLRVSLAASGWLPYVRYRTEDSRKEEEHILLMLHDRHEQ